jgi:L-alanine-DL-glutamate epimerase-like enolase superfamily enzyme
MAAAVSGPVLQRKLFPDPVILESLDLLRNGEEILVRARSRDGVEGLSVTNSWWLFDTHPIFLRRVAPFLVGKDARDLEGSLEGLLREQITYKLQGLALWSCVAAAEMAVLELLGRVSGKPIGDLLGGVQRRDIAVYRASGNRGNTPEEEVEFLRGLVEETGASAVKIRLGSELGENRDSAPGRTADLIPAVRKAFGDEMTLYADANSSYDAEHAIPVGRLLEEHGYAFYEEPCRFDDLWETKKVADALAIPLAGGEQEFSERRFRWTIENRGLDVVQPDLHYYGGYIRATRVARMAHAAGMTCTPHMSGWGLGFLNALHFMSFIPNPAAHMEFKGLSSIPFQCDTSPLACVDGIMRVPSGPGFGIDLDPEWVERSEVVEAGVSL